MSTLISRIDVAAASFPLVRPIRLGQTLVTGRDYTFVRITTENGIVGNAYALTRRLPVAQALVDLVGPLFIGRDPFARGGLASEARSTLGFTNTDTCVARALSLLDIGLWDIAGKEIGKPVSDLLGRRSGERPITISVDGYVTVEEEAGDLESRVSDRARGGISLFKFASEPDFQTLGKRLRAVSDAVPGIRFIVDLLWSLRTYSRARDLSNELAGLDIAWIEDPAPSHLMLRSGFLRRGLHHPLGFGDEATDATVLSALMRQDSIDVLRIDATTVGGLSGAIAIALEANRLGIDVSPHIYPEVHQHLCYSEVGAKYIELFPDDGRFDCSDKFRSLTITLKNGQLAEPTVPGLGLELDWQAIGAHSQYQQTVDRTHGVGL